MDHAGFRRRNGGVRAAARCRHRFDVPDLLRLALGARVMPVATRYRRSCGFPCSSARQQKLRTARPEFDLHQLSDGWVQYTVRRSRPSVPSIVFSVPLSKSSEPPAREVLSCAMLKSRRHGFRGCLGIIDRHHPLAIYKGDSCLSS